MTHPGHQEPATAPAGPAPAAGWSRSGGKIPSPAIPGKVGRAYVEEVTPFSGTIAARPPAHSRLEGRFWAVPAARCRLGLLPERPLGVQHYVDTRPATPARHSRGSVVSTILSTVTAADVIAATYSGLRPRGKLVVVGAAMEPLQIPAAALVGGSQAIVRHASGTARDSEDTLSFSTLSGVRPMIETLPLELAAEAYEKMMSGQARFRMVLSAGAES